MIFQCDCTICDYNDDGECGAERLWIDEGGECITRADNPFKDSEENDE